MELTWVYTIGSLALVSLLSLSGAVFIAVSQEKIQKTLTLMVSFAVGALFGDAFLELIPESLEHFGGGMLAPALVLSGIVGFFVLEKFVRWRHCHVQTSEDHPHPVVFMNLVGDGVHNFIDGLLIGASFMVSPMMGATTTLAVVLHEIPHEIGDFGVLLHGGLKPRKALLLNLASGVTSMAGGAAVLLIGGWCRELSYYLVPITAGGFVYIAGSDLVPELHHEESGKKSVQQLFWMLAGLALMAALVALEGH